MAAKADKAAEPGASKAASTAQGRTRRKATKAKRAAPEEPAESPAAKRPRSRKADENEPPKGDAERAEPQVRRSHRRRVKPARLN